MKEMQVGTSELRGNLASAIARVTDLTSEIATIDRAIQLSAQRIHDARDGIRASERGIEIAREAEVNRLVATAMGQAETDGQTMQEAQAALAAAEESLACAKQAHDALLGQKAPLEKALVYAEMRQKEAYRAVVEQSDAVSQLLQDIRRIEKELLAKGAVLQQLVDHNLLYPGIMEKLMFSPTDGAPGLAGCGTAHGDWAFLLRNMNAPKDAGWEQALSDLQTNAQALLPGEGPAPAAKRSVRPLFGRK